MIDWESAEVQAIYCGERSYDLIQLEANRLLIDDLKSGLKGYLPAKCKASRETWQLFAHMKTVGLEHCRSNGLAKIKTRKAKENLFRKNREIMDRLMNPEDTCIDLVGDGTDNDLLEEHELALKVIEKYKDSTRHKTNWKTVDPMLTNFKRGDVMILCGLSGTGKTNVALQMSYFAGHNTLYYGVDMSVQALGDRILKCDWYKDKAKEYSHYHPKLREECDYSIEADAKAGAVKIKTGIKVYNCDSMTLEQIEFSARNKLETFNAEVLVIDYAGRIESSHHSTDQWRDDQRIARAIKGMAKRLNIKIIALSQFSGKAEKYKKPEYGWMSGSKEFISSSDLVVSLWQASKLENGMAQTDYSKLYISDDIKNRDSGTHGNVCLTAFGLWLMDQDETREDEFQW